MFNLVKSPARQMKYFQIKKTGHVNKTADVIIYRARDLRTYIKAEIP